MLNLIKNVFSDILLLYKNFLHFNISKIIIYLVSILYSIVISLPFVLILWWLYYYIVSSWDIQIIFWNILLSSFFIILAIVWFLWVILSFSYSYVLITKLNIEYLSGKKLNYNKNYYFNFKLFLTYFKTMLLTFFIIISPFLIWAFLLFIIIVIVWGLDSARQISESWFINFITVSSLSLFIIVLLIFAYLMYKTIFTLIVLVDESKWKNFKAPIYYVKRSFELTKWFKKALKFTVIFLLTIIVSLPISFPLESYINSNERMRDYFEIVNNPLHNFDESYSNFLISKYSWEDQEYLVKELSKNEKIRYFLEFLNFLFIFGLFEMMFLSFYRRELLETKKSSNKNISKLKKSASSKKLEEKIPEIKTVKKTTSKKVSTKKTSSKETKINKVDEKKTNIKKTTAKKSTSPKKETVKKTSGTKAKLNVKKTEAKKEETPVKRGRWRPRKTEKK